LGRADLGKQSVSIRGLRTVFDTQRSRDYATKASCLIKRWNSERRAVYWNTARIFFTQALGVEQKNPALAPENPKNEKKKNNPIPHGCA